MNVAGTEQPQGQTLEFRLEFFIGAEIIRDVFHQVTLRHAGRIRGHAGKIQFVVVDPAGVLENVVPDVAGYVQGFLEELLQEQICTTDVDILWMSEELILLLSLKACLS